MYCLCLAVKSTKPLLSCMACIGSVRCAGLEHWARSLDLGLAEPKGWGNQYVT